jgi:hypothetical protein
LINVEIYLILGTPLANNVRSGTIATTECKTNTLHDHDFDAFLSDLAAGLDQDIESLANSPSLANITNLLSPAKRIKVIEAPVQSESSSSPAKSTQLIIALDPLERSLMKNYNYSSSNEEVDSDANQRNSDSPSNTNEPQHSVNSSFITNSIHYPLHTVVSRYTMAYPSKLLQYMNIGDMKGVDKLVKSSINDNCRLLVETTHLTCHGIGSSSVVATISALHDALPDMIATFVSKRLYRKNGCRVLKWKVKMVGTLVALVFDPRAWPNIERRESSGNERLDKMMKQEQIAIKAGKSCKHEYVYTITMYIDDFTNRIGGYEIKPRPLRIRDP